MDGEHGDGEVPEIPPAARTFLERHRPIRSSPSDAGHGMRGDGEDDNGDDGDEAEGQQRVDGESRIEAPEIDGSPNVMDSANPEMLAPPAPHFARAQGRKELHIHRYQQRR